MLRTCTKEELDQYVDFAYELAIDLTKSGYPTYCDRIKTKDMFIERRCRAFERDDEEILLFVLEGEVQGLIHCYWIMEDRYFSVNCFVINTAPETALSEFLAFAGERFPGYEVYLGFPAENVASIRYLQDHGFECIENDYNNTAFLEDAEPLCDMNGMIRIGPDNYDRFELLHSQTDDDMYWNCERMRNDLDNWYIFVRDTGGMPQGAVYYRKISEEWFEIFGIDLDQGKNDLVLFQELLEAALSDAKNRGGIYMTFFCEKDNEAAAIKSGFQCIGEYLCLKTCTVTGEDPA